ncbi:hypothetical protein K450DRAFT_240728 [Umbelopsis ramanniana AG]|uniref:Large ribosomal subunit protein mL53 n=1 Tax=Umbelopsis ramanniana AG TaxID=1314678 RepID=A0AAD5EAZ9_UMBRA|nr:uncharacterized protein K450DRAFT_240728 [Umbelopsis ramanniana AG]KAI8579626.1 hypothetical protein K450DRAFT_240728 [Umbelopsis ramanniana AG]
MLFKHINQVQVAMSPFNVSSRSARLFLNRVQTDAARKASPGLKINTQVLSDPAAKSVIDIAYRDGKKLSFQADEYNIDHIMNMVNKHAKKLEEIEQANA